MVTWENYDTFYTERYLGLPSENADGYRASSVLTYAKDLRQPILLIHGLTDDNVYAQHSMQLADALFNAGKTFNFLPLLGKKCLDQHPAFQFTHAAGDFAFVIERGELQKI